MGRSAKGSKYERDVCRQLSEWWSQGERDDIFWRTAASGGRATQRNKSKRRTFGQYGDIQAVDPIGSPFMRLVTLELKRGYSKSSFADAVDRSLLAAPQMWEDFVEQASTAAELSGTPFWMLVQKRDSREALVFFPRSFYVALDAAEIDLTAARPLVSMRLNLRQKKGARKEWVYAMRLAEFLKLVSPDVVQAMAKQYN